MIRLEDELLIELTRPVSQQHERGTVIEELSKEVSDWDYFVDQAVFHRVAPYVLGSMERLGLKERLSSSELARLQEREAFVLRRREYISRYVAELARACHKVSVESIFLKGIVLQKLVYGTNGTRDFSDIDFIIRFEDHGRVREVLNRNGFYQLSFDSSGDVRLRSDEEILAYTNESKHAPPFMKLHSEKAGRVAVDVHHSLFRFDEPYQVDYHALRENAECVDGIVEVSIYIPDSTDLLIHLCIHHYWHGVKWSQAQKDKDLRLRLLADICMAVSQLDVNWNDFVSRVDRLGVGVPVGVGIIHCEETYGRVFPEEVRERICTPEAMRAICQLILANGEAFAQWLLPFKQRLFRRRVAGRSSSHERPVK